MGGSGSKEKSPSSSGKSGSSKKSRKRSNKSSSSSSPPPTPSSPTAPVGVKPSAPPHPINNVKGMARSGLPAHFVSSPRKLTSEGFSHPSLLAEVSKPTKVRDSHATLKDYVDVKSEAGPRRRGVDVLIVTGSDLDLKVVLQVLSAPSSTFTGTPAPAKQVPILSLSFPTEVDDVIDSCYLARMSGRSVVVARSESTTLGAAGSTAVTARGIDRWKPRMVLFVGATQAPEVYTAALSSKLAPGDVVVASELAGLDQLGLPFHEGPVSRTAVPPGLLSNLKPETNKNWRFHNSGIAAQAHPADTDDYDSGAPPPRASSGADPMLYKGPRSMAHLGVIASGGSALNPKIHANGLRNASGALEVVGDILATDYVAMGVGLAAGTAQIPWAVVGGVSGWNKLPIPANAVGKDSPARCFAVASAMSYVAHCLSQPWVDDMTRSVSVLPSLTAGPMSLNIPPQNPQFIGREPQLKHVELSLFLHGQISVVPEAGGFAGGLGCSAVAVQYANAARDAGVYPGGVIWVQAETAITLDSSFRSIAVALNLSQGDDYSGLHRLRGSVLSALESNPGWLIVFDNASSPELIKPYLPRHNVVERRHVLITGRHKSNFRWPRPTTLGPLEPDNAARLLEKLASRSMNPNSDVTAAEDVTPDDFARMAMYHPLAINLAGAYMARTRTRLTDYASRFSELLAALEGQSKPDDSGGSATTASVKKGRRSSTGHARGASNGSTKTSAALSARGAEFADVTDTTSPGGKTRIALQTAIRLTMAHLEQSSPIPDTILNMLAYIHHDNVPNRLLSSGVQCSEVEYLEAISTLAGFHLVDPDDDLGIVTTHPLIQASTRAELARRGYAKDVVLAVVNVVRDLWSFDYREESTWAQSRSLEPHVMSLILHADALGVTANRIAYLTGQSGVGGFEFDVANNYAEAYVWLSKDVAMTKTLFGEGHEQYGSSLNNLAELLRTWGKFEEALPLYTQALEVLGRNHQYYPTGLRNVSSCYMDMKQNHDALEYAQRAYRAQLAMSGGNNDSPELINDLIAIGELLVANSSPTDAEQYLSDAMNLQAKLFGSNSPATAVLLMDVGHLLSEGGAKAQAREYYQKAMVAREASLSKLHPLYAESCHCLAQTHLDLGNATEAVTLAVLARDLRLELLGKDHPDYVASVDLVTSAEAAKISMPVVKVTNSSRRNGRKGSKNSKNSKDSKEGKKRRGSKNPKTRSDSPSGKKSEKKPKKKRGSRRRGASKSPRRNRMQRKSLAFSPNDPMTAALANLPEQDYEKGPKKNKDPVEAPPRSAPAALGTVSRVNPLRHLSSRSLSPGEVLKRLESSGPGLAPVPRPPTPSGSGADMTDTSVGFDLATDTLDLHSAGDWDQHEVESHPDLKPDPPLPSPPKDT